LRGAIHHQIDETQLAPTTHREPFEIPAFTQDARVRSDRNRRLDKGPNPIPDLDLGRREQIEILGRAMVQVESGKRSTTGQEEPVRALEEGFERAATTKAGR
jgi:hypothetical protein